MIRKQGITQVAKTRSFPFEGAIRVASRSIFQQLFESGQDRWVLLLDGGLSCSGLPDASIRTKPSKFSSSFGNRMDIHSSDQSDLPVAAITQLLRCQAGIESPLSLVEGAEKEIGTSVQTF